MHQACCVACWLSFSPKGAAIRPSLPLQSGLALFAILSRPISQPHNDPSDLAHNIPESALRVGGKPSVQPRAWSRNYFPNAILAAALSPLQQLPFFGVEYRPARFRPHQPMEKSQHGGGAANCPYGQASCPFHATSHDATLCGMLSRSDAIQSCRLAGQPTAVSVCGCRRVGSAARPACKWGHDSVVCGRCSIFFAEESYKTAQSLRDKFNP
jgi:hypothetical protein